MSEQELKKWRNKLKLWILLHPGSSICTCEHCVFADIDTQCPAEFLGIAYETYDIVDCNKGNFPRIVGCGEWIKYV